MLALVAGVEGRGDTVRLEVAELGFAGPAALEVDGFRFQEPVPGPPTPAGRELSFTLRGRGAGANFAGLLQSGLPLAAPVFSFERTPPEPFRTLTVFDATVNDITTALPAGKPLLEEVVVLSFDRYESVKSDTPLSGTAVHVDSVGNTATVRELGSEAPVVGPLADQTVPSGGSLAIPLAVSDADTPDASIVVTVSHPATPLLPPGALTLVGGAPDPELQLSPAAGVSGAVPVTVHASDGSNQGRADFLLTVTGTSGAPFELILSPRVVVENAADGSVVGLVSVSDPDIGDRHTLSLDDDAAGRFALAGDEFVVADGSRLDFEAAGSHAVTISATDLSGNVIAMSFDLRVTDVMEGGFDTWRVANFSAAQLADPAVSGYLGNADGDPEVNLLEYNGGSDPLDASSRPPPLEIAKVGFDGGEHSTLRWRQRDPSVDPLLAAQPQFSTDLQQWLGGGLAFAVISTTDAGAGYQDVTARVLTARPPEGEEYFRLRVDYGGP